VGCALVSAAVANRRSLFSIDAGLPPSGPARWAVLAYMVVGGIVALLVPVFLGIMLWYYLFGDPTPPLP
jgi:hypothetical protein